MKVFIFLFFLLFSGVAYASPVGDCYYKAEFYYNVARARDSNVSKVDMERVVKNFVIENNLSTKHLDDYLAAIQYVYAVGSSPEQIASGIFSECVSPSTKT